jgi:hypothetical protein
LHMNNPLCEAEVQPESESAWEAWKIKLMKDKQALLKLFFFISSLLYLP